MTQCNLGGKFSKSITKKSSLHIKDEDSYETNLDLVQTNSNKKNIYDYRDLKLQSNEKSNLNDNIITAKENYNIYPKFNQKSEINPNTINFNLIKSLCDTKYFKGRDYKLNNIYRLS